jgi:hypothetical protein
MDLPKEYCWWQHWYHHGHCNTPERTVFHLKELSFIVLRFKATSRNDELGEVGNSIEVLIMELWCTPEPLTQDTPLLEASVDSLMPSSGLCLHALVLVVVSSRGLKELIAISVATISQSHLISASKLVAKIITGNSEIMSLSTRVGSIGVHNPASLNVKSHLILDSGSIELLTQPLWVKGTGHHDAEVSSIHGDLALRAIVTDGPVVPFDL